MKRVSSKIAKALKEAGYPIEVKSIQEAEQLGWQGNAFFTGTCTCGLCPYATEVWLWLWREKDIRIQLIKYAESAVAKESGIIYETKDPEESIIAAIEHLSKFNLLK